MTSFIQDIGKRLENIPGLPLAIQYHKEEMLATCQLAGNRKQVVKVWLKTETGNDNFVVCLKSRACVAKDHRFVRQALAANSGLELGNLALETSNGEKLIDVVYNFPGGLIDTIEFLNIVQQIAIYADLIEQTTCGTDRF